MSSGPDNVTSTTTTAPPKFLQKPMETAAAAAVRQYQVGEGINPFNNLDMAYDRAADLTRTRLDTEFAGSGRNLGAAYPARSDELQTLASNIYSPMNLR